MRSNEELERSLSEKVADLFDQYAASRVLETMKEYAQWKMNTRTILAEPNKAEFWRRTANTFRRLQEKSEKELR